jgi:membrane-associated phospholipid phosphatase
MCFGLAYLKDPLPHFLSRFGILLFIALIAFLNKKYSNKLISFIKNLYPLIFLSFFYAETGYMKNIIIRDNLDVYFSGIDQAIWGFQPSLQFSKAMPQGWFNELMNISYISYYFITAAVCIAIYINETKLSYKPIFIIVFSFYLYYIIFDLLPVVGPQFYFDTLTHEPVPPYPVGKFMKYLLLNYEEPTGAFPSSHVGLALILSYVSVKYQKKLTLFFVGLPFVIGIGFATVYLKAHYAVDVLAALITAPIFIWISGLVYNRLLLLNTSYKQNI